MMSSGEFCPECGDPVPSNPIDDTEHPRDSRLCNSCYIERYDLIDAPEKLEITVCAHCGAIYRDGTWEDVNANDYTEVAIEAVTDMLGIHVNAVEVDWQIAPEQVDQTTIRLHCHVTGTLRDTRLTEEVTVPVKIAKGTCSRCGRIAGDYYASTIQLRALDRDPTDSEIEGTKEIANKIVAEREQAGDRDAFITDIAEVTGGLDIRVSTTQLGQVIAN
ncbi:MAG: 60S ribosomal export protein NMD3, partial [Halobacteriaceae archaeon]